MIFGNPGNPCRDQDSHEQPRESAGGVRDPYQGQGVAHKAARKREGGELEGEGLRVVKPKVFVAIIGEPAAGQNEISAPLIALNPALAAKPAFVIELLHPPKSSPCLIKVRMTDKGFRRLEGQGHNTHAICTEIGFFYAVLLLSLGLNGKDCEFFVTSQGLRVIDLDLVAPHDGKHSCHGKCDHQSENGFRRSEGLMGGFHVRVSSYWAIANSAIEATQKAFGF
ncbi:hypothetical protein SELMODRAFT_416190 [Selaginella moellendorffii]|uniref:Uncharacterized protein n=1 Tax=Selaginella moellendorffii TaxID=88036 RepID=D8RYD1_SELML|nr:hypothetical protein SELMODRAFT_416190 [Selaginella moellendorffii]